MASQKRRAFTMVELLVVISIIGVLMALVLPAVVSRLRDASRVECINNQRQVGMALISFESMRGRFPGYANTISGPQSWVVAILPQLDRRDMYDAIGSASYTPGPYGLLMCPEDVQTDKISPWASYVVNAGLPDSGYGGDLTAYRKTVKADGIFNDLSATGANPIPPPVYVSRTDLRDGAATTLMLIENVAARYWTDVPEGYTGFVWTEANVARVNFPDPLVMVATSVNHARPSSRHTGGAVVTFADGHVMFMSNNVEAAVYSALCTPNGANCRFPQSGIIQENDLQK